MPVPDLLVAAVTEASTKARAGRLAVLDVGEIENFLNTTEVLSLTASVRA